MFSNPERSEGTLSLPGILGTNEPHHKFAIIRVDSRPNLFRPYPVAVQDKKEKGDHFSAIASARKLAASTYSDFWSCCGLVIAIVSPTSPTLKRAKRRTEMFSPSLPTLLAISWWMVMPGSFTKGWSRRQTSS